MSVDEILADFVVNTKYANIPQDVITVAKKSLLDTLGVILAANTLGEGCLEFVNMAKDWGREGKSTIIGFGVKTSPPMAAFANGSMAHALDFEEVHDSALVHPSAQSLPAALAVSESLGGVSGQEFIAAIVIGNEITTRLGMALSCNPIEYGWYIPPILGAIGATAAACKILDLSENQLLSAFSLTLCQSGCSAEIIYSPKSIIRAVRDAFPAFAAVTSALLSRKGVTGFNQPISGKGGFFKMFAHDNYIPARLIEGLGKNFFYANISLKPWPSCRGTHAYVQAALSVAEEYKLTPEEIKEICLVVNPQNMILCEPSESRKRPQTAIDAKFSLPFTVASALVYRKLDLDSFAPQRLHDEKVLKLAGRVTYQISTRIRPVEGGLIISTNDGKTYSKYVYHNELYGSPNNPLSKEHLIAKFLMCSRYSFKKPSEETLMDIIDLVLNIEKVKNILSLTELLN